jgi:ATP-dependent Clp protease ATP-binding subunit ClpA
MFERCTESARRAIYFANFCALMSDRREITSVDLLCSLLFDGNSRVQAIFQLRDQFPLYNGCPGKYEKAPKPTVLPLLTSESKQILNWARVEADELRDYWIDTEHMLLGILHVPNCDAAKYLMRTGLTLTHARKSIKQNRHSRPVYGSVSLWWRIKNYLLYPIPV